MLLPAEVVGDIPVIGSGVAGHAGATLDVLGNHLPFATDVGTHRGPRDSATDRSEILTATATDLVTENAADYGAGDGPGDICFASLLNDLFALDPASLLGRSDHRTH